MLATSSYIHDDVTTIVFTSQHYSRLPEFIGRSIEVIG